MRTLVLLILVISCMHAFSTNYFVDAVNGDDSNDGLTVNTALQTIQAASDQTLPGDTVFVLNGTYTNQCTDCNVVSITKSGNNSAWIVYRNYPSHKPIVEFDGWQGFQLRDGASYIEINGFTIKGNSAEINLDSALNQPGGCKNPGGKSLAKYNGNGIQMAGKSDYSTDYPHHIRIVNNTIYNCCGAGISSNKSDYLTIENNLIYNNGWYTLYGCSGITLYQNWNYDNNTTDYRMIIRNNRVFGNLNKVPWVDAPCAITDGNGIIIDDSKNTQNGSTIGAYKGLTLISNNLVYGSGGPGIHVYLSEHVRIINNTTYYNQQSVEILNGEIDAISSNDIVIRNNIMYSKSNKPITADWDNTNVSFKNNLYFGGNGTTVPDSNWKADPYFKNPSLTLEADFYLNSNSYAIDKGSPMLASNVDYDNTTRPIGSGYDIGAY